MQTIKPVEKEQTMMKKIIPQFVEGEKAFSRHGAPITVVKWPVYYGRPGDPFLHGGRYIHPGPGPLVMVRLANKDYCYWPPEWVVKKGGQAPLLLEDAS